MQITAVKTAKRGCFVTWRMSNPSRQISNRRLPPLPNSSRHSPITRRVGSASGARSARNPTNRAGINNQVHSPISHIDLTANLNDGPFRALPTGKALGETRVKGNGKVSRI